MTKGNGATLIRLPLSLVLILFLFWDSPYSPWLAALTVLCAAIADYLDGYWARKHHNVSNFGIYLDAATDKVFVLSGLISLLAKNYPQVPAWIVLIILIRDVLIDGLRSFAAAEGVVIPANRFGKWKTLVTWIALIAVIFRLPGSFGLMLLATGLSVLSGVIYFYQSRALWLPAIAGKSVRVEASAKNLDRDR
jgi:CDP-diacylglycerol---glycerol-3-phosphate 3-phosphatidyltransferase